MHLTPGVFKTYAMRHPRQLLRSWYMVFFQIPWLPEWVLSIRDRGLLVWATAKTRVLGSFDESDRAY